MRIHENPNRLRLRRRAAVALAFGAACIAVASAFASPATPFVAEPIVRNCTIHEPLDPQNPPPLALSPDQIRGFVASPRLRTFDADDPNTSFAFRFSGKLNADPNMWRIEVDALRNADLDPNSNVDANGQAVWQKVEKIRITGGPNVFTFSKKGVKPFFGLPEAWRQGGLGRLRVVAVMEADPTQCAFLPALDRDDLVPANAATIVVADSSEDPTQPPGTLDPNDPDADQNGQSIRDPFNTLTPDYLSVNSGVFPRPPAKTEEAEEATREYYDKVYTDPDGIDPFKSISDTLPTLRSFIHRYFKRQLEECSRDPNDESTRDEPARQARYFNNGDLGIGREMHCINRGCAGELACYVKNFAAISPVDQIPIFDDKALAERALRHNRPFATVAMVERQHMPREAPNRVFFVVYNATGDDFLYSAQLDNKGFNTAIPGNCLQCHGADSTYDANPLNGMHEVKNAFFLPFDLEAFKFFSRHPHSSLSRSRQAAAFRDFNRMVRFHSSVQFVPEASALVEGWYGGDLRGGTFDGSFVQQGWRTSPQHEQLYQNLIAVACRTCHLTFSDNSNRSFATFDAFNTWIPFTKTIVCSSASIQPPKQGHRMPAAEQTLKVLWQSEGRQHLFGQVPGLFGDCRP